MAVQVILVVLLASSLLETTVSGFTVFRGSQQRVLDGLSPRERLGVAARFPAAHIIRLTHTSQAAVSQEGVSLSLDCLPWLNESSQLQRGTIRWTFIQLDEFGNPECRQLHFVHQM